MIPLVAPTITGHDRGYLRQRIATGLLDTETEIRRYEEAFAEKVGCAGAVAVCSGTTAIELALRVLDTGIVSIPSYACVALRNATRRNPVRYLDSHYLVNQATCTLDDAGPDDTIVVHMFGNPTWATQHTIEDYTLSLGNIPQLTGKIGVCSTHATKMISTGRGGILFSNDLHLLHEARGYAYYDTYPQNRHGASLGISSLQAALGISQLHQLDTFIERRREIAATYTAAFHAAGIDHPDPDCGSVYFRYLIRAQQEPARLLMQLVERGIEAGRGVYPPLHQQAGITDDRFPGTTDAVNHLLSVPCHPSLSDTQVRYIAEHVIRVCAP